LVWSFGLVLWSSLVFCLVLLFLLLQDYGVFDFYHAHGCVAVEDSEDDFSGDGFCYVVFYEGCAVKPEVVGSFVMKLNLTLYGLFVPDI